VLDAATGQVLSFGDLISRLGQGLSSPIELVTFSPPTDFDSEKYDQKNGKNKVNGMLKEISDLVLDGKASESKALHITNTDDSKNTSEVTCPVGQTQCYDVMNRPKCNQAETISPFACDYVMQPEAQDRSQSIKDSYLETGITDQKVTVHRNQDQVAIQPTKNQPPVEESDSSANYQSDILSSRTEHRGFDTTDPQSIVQMYLKSAKSRHPFSFPSRNKISRSLDLDPNTSLASIVSEMPIQNAREPVSSYLRMIRTPNRPDLNSLSFSKSNQGDKIQGEAEESISKNKWLLPSSGTNPFIRCKPRMYMASSMKNTQGPLRDSTISMPNEHSMKQDVIFDNGNLTNNFRKREFIVDADGVDPPRKSTLKCTFELNSEGKTNRAKIGMTEGYSNAEYSMMSSFLPSKPRSSLNISKGVFRNDARCTFAEMIPSRIRNNISTDHENTLERNIGKTYGFLNESSAPINFRTVGSTEESLGLNFTNMLRARPGYDVTNSTSSFSNKCSFKKPDEINKFSGIRAVRKHSDTSDYPNGQIPVQQSSINFNSPIRITNVINFNQCPDQELSLQSHLDESTLQTQVDVKVERRPYGAKCHSDPNQHNARTSGILHQENSLPIEEKRSRFVSFDLSGPQKSVLSKPINGNRQAKPILKNHSRSPQIIPKHTEYDKQHDDLKSRLQELSDVTRSGEKGGIQGQKGLYSICNFSKETRIPKQVSMNWTSINRVKDWPGQSRSPRDMDKRKDIDYLFTTDNKQQSGIHESGNCQDHRPVRFQTTYTVHKPRIYRATGLNDMPRCGSTGQASVISQQSRPLSLVHFTSKIDPGSVSSLNNPGMSTHPPGGW
jgi:hypothetical protein